jgi:membrane protein required for colicin V production
VTFFDFILLAVIVGFLIKGLGGGFARVGVGFIATVVGIFCAFWSYGTPAAWIMPYVNSRPVANLLGFLVILIIFGIAGSVVGNILGSLFRWAGLSWLDRVGGAAFGLVQGVVVAVALVTVVLACSPEPPPDVVARSSVVPYLLGPSRVMAAMIPRELHDSFHDATTQVRKVWPQPHSGDKKN